MATRMATTLIMEILREGSNMERLDFVLTDFTRRSWVGKVAQDVWEPRFQHITRAWQEMEWLAVAAGLRDCAAVIVTPDSFVQQAGEWAKHGLSGMPVEIQGLSLSSYSNTTVPTELGKPYVYRVVVGTPPSVTTFKNAWDENDHDEIGCLLGYPPCCHQFFFDVWVEHGLVDTTWPMAVAAVSVTGDTRSIEVSGPPEANILWRWLGLRAVPHLPCSFTCQSTVELGRQFIQIGREAGYKQEMDWLLEILSWPVQWSALHGIAEIKTPLIKMSTRTDATAHEYIVQRPGSSYPDEGARGLGFPYQSPVKPLRSRRKTSPPPQPDWYAADNGFTSTAAMTTAHGPIVAAALAVLPANGGAVLDLGCGNGVLLQKICQANPAVVPFGLEINNGRVAHAHQLHPTFAANFLTADLFTCDEIWSSGRQYTLAILMPGRLLEVSTEQADKLRARLHTQCDHILLYAYGDWLKRYGTLTRLAKAANLKMLNNNDDDAVAYVRIK